MSPTVIVTVPKVTKVTVQRSSDPRCAPEVLAERTTPGIKVADVSVIRIQSSSLVLNNQQYKHDPSSLMGTFSTN